ncbi:MAG: AAA family ATPase, partial [Acidobacteriota bacterium]
MAKAKPQKPRSVYCCSACGHVESKWLGKCPACQEWSTLVEEVAAIAPVRASAAGVADGQGPQPIDEIGEHVGGPRRGSGIGELDRVLGGGLVAGSIVLLGGDPGVGKSTLLVQMLAGLAGEGPEVERAGERQRAGTVLYATGEESVAQTAMRARRVGAAASAISIVAETDVEKILAHAREARPAILAVDSIQTVYTPILDSIPGSLAQVRECASRLMQFAKTTGTPTIVVGHVTKDGAIARGRPVLYATGEESVAQTALRARRVGAARADIAIVAETDVEKILAHAAVTRPAILAVDSVQTVFTPILDSIPGSLAQVRECASRLMQFAKTTGTPTIVVGHVTKDGGIAGPKTLEHIVD